MIRLFGSFLSPWLKSPSIPLYERGMTIMGSPLWKRGVRGDFVEIFNSIGVILNLYSLVNKKQTILVPRKMPFVSRCRIA